MGAHALTRLNHSQQQFDRRFQKSDETTSVESPRQKTSKIDHCRMNTMVIGKHLKIQTLMKSRRQFRIFRRNNFKCGSYARFVSGYSSSILGNIANVGWGVKQPCI